MLSNSHNGLISVELLKSCDCGLACLVLGDEIEGSGDGATVGVLKLTDLSRGVFGEVGGRRKRRGIFVDETGRICMSGRFGVTLCREGDEGCDGGRGGRSVALLTSAGEDSWWHSRDDDASSTALDAWSRFSNTSSFVVKGTGPGSVAPGTCVVIEEERSCWSTDSGARVGEEGKLAGRGGSSSSSTRPAKKD